ncbi:MAG: HAMP domain-containing protein [Alphaproteobacteria bacterium]|nr:HAMP domain-containing protein [Alphaproteobacteria bacterium]
MPNRPALDKRQIGPAPPRRCGVSPSFEAVPAVLYASLYLASTLLLLAVLFAFEVQSTRETARQRNAGTLAWLQKEFESGGVNALRAAVARSIALPVPTRTYFRLASPEGRELISTLPAPIAAEGEEEISFATEDGASEGAALIRTIVLGEGYRLSAGRDVSRLVWTQWLFARASLFAFAGSLLLGTLVGAAMGWGIFQRIGAMNRLIEDITKGDLGQRLAVSRRGDELDQTAASFNRMLDMVQRLMGDLRHVTNNIAHDLRTPLMRLERKLEEISASTATGSREADLADEALAEANQILEIFNALLRIAQIEGGSASAIFETVDLSAVVRTIEDAYLPLAEEDGRQLFVETQ